MQLKKWNSKQYFSNVLLSNNISHDFCRDHAFFRVVAKNQPIENKTATLTIIGNETGGRASVTVTVNKQQVATSGGDL